MLLDNEVTFKLQYRAMTEQSQWSDVGLASSATWPSATFCDTDSSSPNRCTLGCPEENEQCCRVIGETCETKIDSVTGDFTDLCCGNVGLTCLNNVCNYEASTSTALLPLDATFFDDVEGQFEMRVVSSCGVNFETASESVLGRIDRVPPRLFGKQFPSYSPVSFKFIHPSFSFLFFFFFFLFSFFFFDRRISRTSRSFVVRFFYYFGSCVFFAKQI